MYTYAHDARSTAVMLFSGSSHDAADLERYHASIKELDEASTDPAQTVVVVVFDEGTPLPSSTWRKAMAEATKNLRVKPIRAVVSPSPFARTVVTAVAWLRRESPFEDATVVPTLDEAIAWVEARRGPRRAVVERLFAEARAQSNDLAKE